MKKRFQQGSVQRASLRILPLTWMAGVAAWLSPTTQSPAQAQVIPTAAGAGTQVTETGDQYDIEGGTQAAGNLFHEFDEFSLTAAETANFVSDSGVFNIVGQVSAANPSYIDGTVQVSGSDANLYLVNPAGVLFGPDAQVSLSGSFSVTTADQLEFDGAVLNVLDNGADYSAFTGDPSAFHFTETSASAVVNQGTVTVAPGEAIALIGGNVVNTGTLSAPGGEIGLVAVGGESTVRYSMPGSLLSLEMAESSVPNGSGFAVTDLPTLLTGSATPLATELIMQSDGSYKLGPVQMETEEVSVTGEISTRATTGDGGAIALLGRSHDVVGAVIDASGDNGGNIRIGRDISRQGTFLPTADLLLLNRTSVVRADGLDGAGGDIAIGSDTRAFVQGDLSARGTTMGGLVETSSSSLNLYDLRVDASGPVEAGRWLSTSNDIVIGGDPLGFNQIDPSVIVSTLDGGTDVEITTIEPGGSGDIVLSESIAQNGGGNANLALTGRRFINNGSTIDLSSAGQLALGINQVNAESKPDSSSIESAISAIGNVNGDRLLDVGGGLYDFSGALDVNTQVEILGAGVDGTRFQDTSGDRLFNILAGGDLGLRNLGLTKSPTGPALGGGITNNGGALTITDTVLFQNAADNGGAIEVSNGGLLSIVSSTLHQNTAVGSGGGIQLLSGSRATVVDTVFAGNSAGENGGGIDVAGQVALVLDDVTVVANTAESRGGGVFAQDATVDITNSSFLNNSATLFNGGGIALHDGDLTLSNVDLTGNQAGHDGGGVALLFDSVGTIDTESRLVNNVAGDDGGGLYLSDGSSASVENTQVLDNSAADGGGGLYASFGSSLQVSGTTVDGNSAADGGGLRVMESSIVRVVEGTRFTNNRAVAGEGGAISVDSSEATLHSVEILDNSAVTQGGGVAQRAGTLVITESDLFRNETDGQGGGIAISDAATTTLDANTGLFDNQAVGNGGGLATTGTGTLDIEAVLWNGNQAGGSGGGLYQMSSGALAIDSTTFEENTAGVTGGALSLSGGGAADSTGAVDITSAIFHRNEAVDDGGAIAYNATDQTLTLRNATFSENVSQEEGGAVFANNGTTTLVNDSQFIANRASHRGGGLAIVNGSHVVLTDTVVANNETPNRGGGLYVDHDGTVTVTGTLTTDSDGIATGATSRFVDNQAGRDGGGILAWDEAVLDLNGVLFRGNFSGDDGGGVAVTELSRATIANTNFENNTVAEKGGGLYSNGLSRNELSGAPSDSRIVLEDSRFIDNEAGEFGGGLYHGINGSAVVQESLFRGNTAVEDGGGVHVTSGTLALENSQLLANQAQFGAGLAVDTGGDVMVADTAFTENVAAAMGGGAASDRSSHLQVSGSTFERNEAVSGGGLFNLGIADIVNATFSGNLAQADGGGIRSDSSEAALTLRNTTLTANSAGTTGGGIADANSQLIRLHNTIVAGNTSAVSADVNGRFVDDGNNLIGSLEGATGFTNSVWVGSAANPIDPKLAPLAENGGPTRTHAPLVNSVAVDAGSDVTLPGLDQRGLLRVAGSAVDIGAVELSDAELANPVPVPDPAPTVSEPAPPAPEPIVLVPDPVPDPSEPDPSEPDPSAPTVTSTELTPGLLEPTVSTTDASERDVLLSVRKRYDLDDADAAIRRLEQSFSQGFEDYWDLSAGPDLTFSEVQAILRRAQDEYKVNSAVVYAIFTPEEPSETAADTILQVESAAAGDDLLNLSVVMPEGELVSYQLPVTRNEVVRQVRYFRSTVSDPDDVRGYQPLAQQLYQWLLAPLEADLATQNVQNLMYALDAGLRTAPIAAMRDYEGFSLERYGLSVVPSMGLMQADFPVSVRRSTVAMGVSEFTSESPLPAVPIELQMVDQFVPVSQTLLNEATTLDAIKSVQALEQPGVLHLATHANFDRRSPEESYIHLWNEPLNMQEFSELDWAHSDLEMLILSACSTALGSRNAELGFAGLAAASGVDATVGSLWQVSDVGTLALMSEFYAQLEETNVRFEALRQAQLALLKGETRIEGGNLITGHGEVTLPEQWNLPESATLDHPFFWSAFTMVGNPW